MMVILTEGHEVPPPPAALELLRLLHDLLVLLSLPRDPDEDPDHEDGQEEASSHGHSDQTCDGLLGFVVVKDCKKIR